ncbi:MAG: hypothetical protein JF597_00680 [Streptomyces sp.]|uniref:hypothetical protein n=1 Tax=Streptomyces sp. TaxID=1931 RepID=UPI0025F66BA4|nr:hypothetical protein [Streptomyces sp.]MBW8792153.1 hypothetical protein [Streptomyces sp.]
MTPPGNLPARRASRLPGANTGPLRRRPVAPVAPVATEFIVNRSPHLLRAELDRGRLAGEYGAPSPVRRTRDGSYAVKVHRLKPRPPRWRKPAIIVAVVLALLVAVGAAAWWALASLAAAIPGGLVGGLILLGILLAIGSATGGSKVVDVLVRVRVR